MRCSVDDERSKSMISNGFKVLAFTVCVLMAAQDAFAWGSHSRGVIALGALQIFREKYPEAFKAGAISYDADLIRGADNGAEIYQDIYALNTDQQTIDAVSSEIALLRTARDYGAGSYFAYRMGVFSSLLSEIMIPYGVPFTPEDARLNDLASADLDAHIGKYTFSPKQNPFRFIRSADVYIAATRPFYPDDLDLIKNDYRSDGKGYAGFLENAGMVYLERSIEATLDAWYSVYTADDVLFTNKPSDRILAFYFVEEIAYLLGEKQSIELAERAYRMFESVNTNLMEAHQHIGDLFYDMGTKESKERGIREWKVAYRSTGAYRKSASKRLSRHYMGDGNTYLRNASGPSANETDLGDALRSFQLALRYDSTNENAANRISDTSAEISDRDERYSIQQRVISNSATVIQQAEKSLLSKDYGNALTSYNSALILLDVVDSEFSDLKKVASDQTREIKKSMKDVVADVVDVASEKIDSGDTAARGRKYEEALKHYALVASIVSAIPLEEGSASAQRIQDLIDTADKGIRSAELALKRK